MWFDDRRKELGLSIKQLYKISGVPCYRLLRLEQGIESLYLIPYKQACDLACALEYSAEEWYNMVYSITYKQWLSKRMNCRGV